jgi:hypothetical protein
MKKGRPKGGKEVMIKCGGRTVGRGVDQLIEPTNQW